MANERFERFVALMKEIFELDKSDLDFGIYRIMNIRRKKIEQFLTDGLSRKVQETLAPFATDHSAAIERMAAIEKQCAELGIEIATSPTLAAEYEQLKRRRAAGTDLSGLETDVYSALYNFFNRYYDEGDFISKRRYKEGVYAIPYEGEEVKLYWANQDQYYIKTSENFRDYAFVEQGVTVHFRLVDATQEQNNNKESDDSKRVFMLYTETEDAQDVRTFEYDPEKQELMVRFVFDLQSKYSGKNIQDKWTADNYGNIVDFIVHNCTDLAGILLNNISDDPKKPKTVLSKHLEAYVAKNTFDYFIHKDLGGFLRRELDFYIKNEIMHLDDLDTENEKRVETWLAKVKAVKRVGAIIIDFLAQIEDFQKKLWLKKKFVVNTDWCITLDQIEERFYPEIIANKEQIAEWISLYAIDEADGWTDPPTTDFLRHNTNLVVDTRHFSRAFRDKLVERIDGLDEKTNGLMVWGDNYHALRLLQRKLYESIDYVYIDPPYNTAASEIIYKNGYKHSSWNTMMECRIKECRNLLKPSAFNAVTIDYEELFNIGKICDEIYGSDARIGIVTIFINPKGRQHEKYFASSTEYMLVWANCLGSGRFNQVTIDEEKSKEFVFVDDYGKNYRLDDFRRMRTSTLRRNKPKGYYPIYVSKDLSVISKSEIPQGFVVYPISDDGVEYTWKIIETEFEEYLAAGLLVAILEDGKIRIKNRYYEQQVFHNIWTDKKYFPEFQGTNLLKDILGDNIFSYPKSVYAVADAAKIMLPDNGLAFDYFAGSGTTGHAILNLNRADGGNRKYILVEMGNYFHTVTLPRMKKVVYSPDWKGGKPTRRSEGMSQIIKVIRLESYEDALSNVELDTERGDLLSGLFGDEYLIRYMMDTETRDSLLNVDAFRDPFHYIMKITENNEARLRPVDVVETFNYLIGLSVVHQGAVQYFTAAPDVAGDYENAVRLTHDDGGDHAFQQIEGTLPDGRRALVIWRTVTEDLMRSNAALDAYFSRYRINPADREYDVIYVNGDNNLENIRADGETWKVVMTETEFKERMFEEE